MDNPTLHALGTGLLLGVAAGLAPGPLMTLVIARSLSHGSREGCKVAMAPLVTDAPIIGAAFALAGHLAKIRLLLGLLSFAGGFFVLYLALETFRAHSPVLENRGPVRGSWQRGVLVNLLSPHPWIFWMTVGVVTLSRTMSQGSWETSIFLGAFYLCLVGAKITLAILAGRSRHLLHPDIHRWILRCLSVALAVFACLLLSEGWTLTTGTTPGNP